MSQFRPSAVLTIGTFDGVHRGHQALLRAVVAQAAASSAASALLTFDPHPQSVLRGKPMPLICTGSQRLKLIEGLGLDALYLIPFSRELAALSPQEFLHEYVLAHFTVRKLIIGYDFAFGHNRKGTPGVVSEFATRHGFGWEAFPAITENGNTLSSSRIRRVLAQGDFDAARAMLGRPFSVLDMVVQGNRNGRQLGFPTANQSPAAPLPIPHGVYAARVRVEQREYSAVCNYGIRPTVGAEHPVLESHLFSFEDELYGKEIEVIPTRFLRGEKKFPSLDALRAQIVRDADQAKSLLRAC